MEFDNVMLSRILTTLTLSFHIIFATIGVGIPLMVSIAEFIGIKKNDSHYLLLARRWTRGFVITVAIGVVTGTCIGLQLSLLWPSFMKIAGQAISLPLFMETFAFFFEAIFLGIYLYTWDRFKNPLYHWMLSIPIVLGASMSAFFITTVNAFMNTPQGFQIVNGVIKTLDPIEAMFNPATPTKTFHVLATAYVTSAFILATIGAFQILRGKNTEYTRKALHLTVASAFIFAILTGIAGDLSAKFLAKYQPEKLAAIEWHFETEKGADLVLFGVLDEEKQEVKYAIHLPKMLSFLSFSNFDGEVIGLNEFPKDEIPPLYIHYLFDIKVMFAMFMVLISFLYVVFSKWKKEWMHHKWLLRAIVLCGPLAMISIELGWFLAEVGRQPWILRGYMKVSEAATTSNGVGEMLWLFFGLYALLAIVCTIVLRKMFINNPAEAELEYRFRD
ncbi:cytochrome bd ubiquinol oxidase subunit I [Bacillus methanolicus PB1]|uniref:Cytochrome bd ubiquinol oxidase subunit I n=1 Tax=Bacillus methanolicus PB1 TaxID=997296 RepID=I3DX00_BACMT|nr:cytochrome ubiquinol oxidase subunit I [Bacillus methanolicus]EIJ78771.1 cytochrome bd ubiquinol oxidase subunit I [Bacillus methanolicus PB1]